MEVYHASMVRVERPDVYHSRKFLDFGQGFYVTTLKDQAVKYAQRFIRRGKEAWLNIYELDEDFMSSSFIIREFENTMQIGWILWWHIERELLLAIMIL